MTQNATQDPFVRQLHAWWTHDPALAVLAARYAWKKIPEGIIPIAQKSAGFTAQAQRAQQNAMQVQQHVNVLMGTLGASPQYGSHAVADPQQMWTAAFYQTLGYILQYQGDPPPSPHSAPYALSVLMGQTNPLVPVSFASGIPLQTLIMTVQYAGQMGSMFTMLGMLQAALEVPRDQILQIPLSIDLKSLRSPLEEVQELLEQAVAALHQGDADRAHDLHVDAIVMAMKSPEPDDDIAALFSLFRLTQSIEVPGETIELAAQCVLRLANHSHLEEVIQCLALVGMLANIANLEEPTLRRLVKAGTSVITRVGFPAARMTLAHSTHHLLLRFGELDAAADHLRSIPRDGLDAGNRLSLASMMSDVQIASGDKDAAVADLLAAVEKESGATEEQKRAAIHKVVAHWPMEREGLQKWLSWVKRDAENLDEPARSLVYLQLAIASARAGERGRAIFMRSQAKSVDELTDVPPQMLDFLRYTYEQIDELLDPVTGQNQ